MNTKVDCDVAVIIPTKNRLSFLKTAIESVLNQTVLPKEIIIVDDDSQDGTQAYVLDHPAPQVKLLKNPGQGPASGRNFGVAQSHSTWIAFLDSDDYWLPDKLQEQLNFLKLHKEFKACQTEEIWIRNGVRVNPKKKHQKPSGHIFFHCLKMCLISPSSVMIERKLFEELEGFDTEFEVCEDYELWLRLSLRTPFKTLVTPQVVKRGGHSDQLSKKYWGMDRFRVMALEKLLANHKTLSTEQQSEIMKEIFYKLNILAKGFSKHKPQQKNIYRERMTWFKENYPHVPINERMINYVR